MDEAIRRRFHLVPFAVTIPPEERDGELTEKLKAEWPGILAWIVAGCLKCQSEGFNGEGKQSQNGKRRVWSAAGVVAGISAPTVEPRLLRRQDHHMLMLPIVRSVLSSVTARSRSGSKCGQSKRDGVDYVVDFANHRT